MEIEVITGPEIDAVFEPPVEQTTKIGTPEFIKSLLIEFNKKKVWRSLSSLANTLHVDPQALSGWLDYAPKSDCSLQFVSRAGKEKGTLYYAISSRIKTQSTPDKEVPLCRASRVEDDYALSQLHMVYFLLYKILKTYGLEISQRDVEAFSNLTTSLDKLESGLLLFSKKIKASMDKLPKFN